MVMQKGLSMNARIVGSGKQTVVLAHGYGADQSVWEKVVPKLGEKYQLLLFDWCFSGAIKDRSLFDAAKYCSYEAFADDMIGLLEELNLTSCVFLGHSMSGMIGCIASVKRPDLFTKLILVASSPRFINLEDYEWGFERSDVDQLFADIETNYDQWCSAFAALVVDASDPASVEKLGKSLKRMGVEVGLPLAKTVFLSDHRSVLDEVVAPVTLIHTKRDHVVPSSAVAFMQSRIKGETAVEIVNTEGHFPQLTAHEEFLEVVFAAVPPRHGSEEPPTIELRKISINEESPTIESIKSSIVLE